MKYGGAGTRTNLMIYKITKKKFDVKPATDIRDAAEKECYTSLARGIHKIRKPDCDCRFLHALVL
jgi:hypothetical protein